ncbi:hypothetical protein ACIO52_02920 [Nocardia sp. NPDC087230]|uniref:hypothetical protein n=1 Tax=Nocardia sp. NPDC087230 TaxID=3364331 RepID=UPI00382900D9
MVVGVGLFLVGIGRMVLTRDLGDPIALRLTQTSTIVLIVFYVLDWLPLQHSRR